MPTEWHDDDSLLVVSIQMLAIMDARLHCLTFQDSIERWLSGEHLARAVWPNEVRCTPGRGRCRWVASLLVLVLSLVLPELASAESEFSREYKTPCTTCHIDPPKLNDLGSAFKDNGFNFPEKDVVLLQIPRTLLTATLARGSATESAESQLHELDQRQLNLLRKRIKALRFPFAFRFSQAAKEKSRRFDKLNEKPVLDIRGRYYAVYSCSIAQSQRVIETIRNVILPILKLAVGQFAGNPQVQGYAIEVSHQVRGKVLGVTVETPENVALVLPEKVAEDIVASTTSTAQETMLHQAQVFVNGEARELEIEHQP